MMRVGLKNAAACTASQLSPLNPELSKRALVLARRPFSPAIAQLPAIYLLHHAGAQLITASRCPVTNMLLTANRSPDRKIRMN
jgi:hypothetical protein